MADIPGVTGARAGTYVFYDLMHLGSGTATEDQLALSALCTVVSRRTPDRLTIDGGSKTFSGDRGVGGPPDLAAASHRFVLHSLQRDRCVIFVRGDNARLWDADGREYLEHHVEPTRRQILDLLERPRRVGELTDRLGLTQPGTSKHLRVLREAGLVQVRREAQRRWYELRLEPLVEVGAWLRPYRRLLSERPDALGETGHLGSAVAQSKCRAGMPW